MKHVILGDGNLGRAIASQLSTEENEVIILSKSMGWEYPQSGFAEIKKAQPDMIWNTIGAGSIAEGEKFFDYHLMLHVGLPSNLAIEFPEVKQVHFSSNYAEEMNGRYGLSKFMMELALSHTKQKNWRVIRVESIVGYHKPEKTVIGKILKAYRQLDVKLSTNPMRISSAKIIAEHVCSYYVNDFDGQDKVHAIGGYPYTAVDVFMEIEKQLGLNVNARIVGLDKSRPVGISNIDTYISSGNKLDYMVKSIIDTGK